MPLSVPSLESKAGAASPLTSPGFCSVIPSHHTSPSSVMAQFVKMEFRFIINMALAFDFMLVPGATPKKPYSGLMA